MEKKLKNRGINGGFSLVELIIVIAIIAVLATAMVPAIMHYIDKSKKSNDISSAKTIKTAIETAMSDEWVYETLMSGCNATPSITDMDGNSYGVSSVITITNDLIITNSNTGVAVSCNATSDRIALAEQKISNNIGESTPRICFKKAADSSKTGAPTGWSAYCTQGGSVIVGIVSSDGFYQLAPTLSAFYQD